MGFYNSAIRKLNTFPFLLISIFLSAFLLRIIGTNPGFPQAHPDEPVIYATSVEMILKNSINPFSVPIYKFAYPGLIIYLYAILFKFVFIPLSAMLSFISGQSTSQADILGHGFINAMFWSRYLNAFLSSLSVPLVYLIGKKIFNKKVGVIAAFFLSFNYRHVLSSHFGLLDSTNATFALLVLYLCLKTLENPSLRNYIFTAASVALSLATKLNFFSILPFVLIHIIISGKKANAKLFVRRFFSLNLLLGIFSIIFVFLILNPYLPFNISTAKHTLDRYNMRIGLFSPPLEVTFPSIWYLYEIGFGKIMFLLFLIGTIFLIYNRKQRVNGILLLFFIVLPSVLLLYLSHGGAYVRYFASITPFAVLISAYAFWIVIGKVNQLFKTNKKKMLLVAVLAAFFVSFDQLKNSLTLDYFAVKPWNSSCIENWMDTNIKTRDNVAINNLVSRSKQIGVHYSSFSNTEDYKTPFSISELQDKNIDYVVANIEDLRGRFNWWLSSSAFFWGIPIQILDNSFDGIALKELSRYIVETCTKPWQSPDNNFIAIKIPKKSDPKNIVFIQSYDFKPISQKTWKVSAPFYLPVRSLKQDRVAVVVSNDCLDEYCLQIKGESSLTLQGNVIFIDLVAVESGKRYVVKANVKSDRQLNEKTRDGFLRIDFYSNTENTREKGILASVSPRYFGESTWKELTVSQVSPPGAKYLQVSFQVERYNATFLIDEVKVYSSDEKPSREEIDASKKKEIENDVLYPLSLL